MCLIWFLPDMWRAVMQPALVPNQLRWILWNDPDALYTYVHEKIHFSPFRNVQPCDPRVVDTSARVGVPVMNKILCNYYPKMPENLKMERLSLV